MRGMANVSVIAILLFGICISSSLNFSNGEAMEHKFKILCHVYCDTCRVEFETRLSQPIDGAIMKLQYRNRTDGSMTYQSKEVMTGKEGNYEIDVEGDYGKSDCEVALVKSPKADCHDPAEEWRKASVVLTALDGIRGDFRFANNLGFEKNDAFPECIEILKELDYFQLMEEVGEPTPSELKENNNIM